METRAIAHSAPAAAEPQAAPGRDEFLKLLIAQLTRQNPLEPVKETEFIAQLAQFATVEQIANANERLAEVALAQAAQVHVQAASLVGREVTFHGGAVELPAEGAVALDLELRANAAKVRVDLVDERGKAVRSLDLGAREAGRVQASWDGLDGSGLRAPAGRYRVEVVAEDASGAPVAAAARNRGRVEAVLFEKGYPELVIAGARIALGDVVEVR